MSIVQGVFTLAEIDEQIANIKAQLLAPNAGYSVSPGDGGASRSVQRNRRDQLNAELTLWMRRRQQLTAVPRRSRVLKARFPRRCC